MVGTAVCVLSVVGCDMGVSVNGTVVDVIAGEETVAVSVDGWHATSMTQITSRNFFKRLS
jgi:hypothetical protein